MSEPRLACGVDFCEQCGDCLVCFAEDRCYDDEQHDSSPTEDEEEGSDD